MITGSSKPPRERRAALFIPSIVPAQMPDAPVRMNSANASGGVSVEALLPSIEAQLRSTVVAIVPVCPDAKSVGNTVPELED